jgi:hypothetical protein
VGVVALLGVVLFISSEGEWLDEVLQLPTVLSAISLQRKDKLTAAACSSGVYNCAIVYR